MMKRCTALLLVALAARAAHAQQPASGTLPSIGAPLPASFFFQPTGNLRAASVAQPLGSLEIGQGPAITDGTPQPFPTAPAPGAANPQQPAAALPPVAGQLPFAADAQVPFPVGLPGAGAAGPADDQAAAELPFPALPTAADDAPLGNLEDGELPPEGAIASALPASDAAPAAEDAPATLPAPGGPADGSTRETAWCRAAGAYNTYPAALAACQATQTHCEGSASAARGLAAEEGDAATAASDLKAFAGAALSDMVPLPVCAKLAASSCAKAANVAEASPCSTLLLGGTGKCTAAQALAFYESKTAASCARQAAASVTNADSAAGPAAAPPAGPIAPTAAPEAPTSGVAPGARPAAGASAADASDAKAPQKKSPPPGSPSDYDAASGEGCIKAGGLFGSVAGWLACRNARNICEGARPTVVITPRTKAPLPRVSSGSLPLTECANVVATSCQLSAKKAAADDFCTFEAANGFGSCAPERFAALLADETEAACAKRAAAVTGVDPATGNWTRGTDEKRGGHGDGGGGAWGRDSAMRGWLDNPFESPYNNPHDNPNWQWSWRPGGGPYNPGPWTSPWSNPWTNPNGRYDPYNPGPYRPVPGPSHPPPPSQQGNQVGVGNGQQFVTGQYYWFYNRWYIHDNGRWAPAEAPAAPVGAATAEGARYVDGQRYMYAGQWWVYKGGDWYLKQGSQWFRLSRGNLYFYEATSGQYRYYDQENRRYYVPNASGNGGNWFPVPASSQDAPPAPSGPAAPARPGAAAPAPQQGRGRGKAVPVAQQRRLLMRVAA